MATDPLFGIHAQALSVQRQRLELIASNLANADTPGFQARDLDFRKLLADAGSQAASAMSAEPQYRVPLQPSVDGNSVDVQIEQAQYADAALRYQASLGFMDSRIKSMITALTGQ